MNSSVSGVLKIFLMILIITLATIGLLGLLEIMEKEQMKDLLFKSGAVVIVLGVTSILIAALTGSKKSSD
jgi:hypothetical protein